MLQFYSASTGIVNSQKAMTHCLNEVQKQFNQSVAGHPCLLIFHTTIGHQYEELVSTAFQHLPEVQLAGCSVNGIIGKEGANEDIRALAIMLVIADAPGEFNITYAPSLSGRNSLQIGQQLGQQLKDENPMINMILLLTSGIDLAADQLILGIESIWGNQIPIFGGAASDNMRGVQSYQFFNQQIITDGIVAIGFADQSLKIEMGVHHGNIPIGVPLTVTKAEQNLVYEFDEQPAWQYLIQKLKLPQDSKPGPCIPFTGLAQRLPNQLQEAYDNSHILRVITQADEENKRITMLVNCEEGTQLWLTQRDEDRIFDGVEQMLGRVLERINPKQIAAVFHTDCAARGRALFDRIAKEEIIEKIQSPFNQHNTAPWLGMYGFGEFTQLMGKNLFHNYTTSLYVLYR